MKMYKSTLGIVACFLITRPCLYLLMLLFFVSDPVKDFMYFNGLMDNWQASLTRQSVADAQYPPGLGLMMQLGSFWTLPHPFDVRASFMLWDAVATFLAIFYLRSMGRSHSQQILVLVFMIPLTAIWAQDEVIAAAFLVFIIFLLSRNYWHSAIVVSVIALSCVKIFFLPLCGWLLVAAWRRNLSRYWLVMMAACIVLSLLWQASGEAQGLSTFIPPNDFGISLWSLAPAADQASAGFMYRTSLLMFAIVGGLWCMYSLFCMRLASSVLLLFSVLLHVFTLLFYHVSPEYLVFFCWPYLLLPQTSGFNITLQVFIIWALAWGVNVFDFLQKSHPDLMVIHDSVLIFFNLASFILLINIVKIFFNERSRVVGPGKW